VERVVESEKAIVSDRPARKPDVEAAGDEKITAERFCERCKFCKRSRVAWA
jgi:hypothetical protein